MRDGVMKMDDKRQSVLRSARNDVPCLKKIRQRTVPCLKKRAEKIRQRTVPCLILAVAVGLIVVGILNGGFGDVLEKAKKICMECIGLG